MVERDIVVPELDGDGRITAASVIGQIEEIAAEAAPPLDVSGGVDGAVQIGGAYSQSPEYAPGAQARGALAVAIGSTAEAAPGGVAISGKAQTLGSVAVAGTAGGNYSIAVGSESTAPGMFATAIGVTAEAPGRDAIAVGNGAGSSGRSSVAIGSGAIAENDNDFVLGTKNHNVNVPGTLSVQEPAEPQHAATKEYVDGAVASAGGGGLPGVHAGAGRPDDPDTLDQPVPDDAVLFVSTDARDGATMWTRSTSLSESFEGWVVAAGRLSLTLGGTDSGAGADLAIFASGESGVSVVEEVGKGWVTCVYTPGIRVDLEAHIPARRPLAEGEYLGFLVDPAVNDSPGGLSVFGGVFAEISSHRSVGNPITPQRVTLAPLGTAPDGREMLAIVPQDAGAVDLGDEILNIKASVTLSPYLSWPGRG